MSSRFLRKFKFFNFLSNVFFLDGNKQTISFRRQRLDIDCMLPQAVNYLQNFPNAEDPYIIDMIKMADNRITQLQTELDDCKQSKEITETKLTNFKTQASDQKLN